MSHLILNCNFFDFSNFIDVSVLWLAIDMLCDMETDLIKSRRAQSAGSPLARPGRLAHHSTLQVPTHWLVFYWIFIFNTL